LNERLPMGSSSESPSGAADFYWHSSKIEDRGGNYSEEKEVLKCVINDWSSCPGSRPTGEGTQRKNRSVFELESSGMGG